MNEIEERKHFGAQLRALRKARGLSAKQVEVNVGIDAKTLCNCEIGLKTVTWGTYCRLYNYFSCDEFPQYRPIAQGVRLIPTTETLLGELDELTKTRRIKEISRGCKFPDGSTIYNIMYGKVRVVRRSTLQNIFNYLGWGEIADEKMGEYPTR